MRASIATASAARDAAIAAANLQLEMCRSNAALEAEACACAAVCQTYAILGREFQKLQACITGAIEDFPCYHGDGLWHTAQPLFLTVFWNGIPNCDCLPGRPKHGS